jgi:hypothetical protein
MNPPNLSLLLTHLAERAANAAIGRSRIVHDPLREALRDQLSQTAGKPGSFLAEPLVEAVFGWQRADRTMQQLADEGLLAPNLVDALSRTQPIQRDQVQPRNSFPRHRTPYRHQLESWRALASEPPRPLVVTSGTGSGKTECFLVPILNDLARQTALHGRLIGVQALFLYPLNALIASQRERLADWTEPFGGNIRFSLYNGNTPEQVPQDVARETPWEVRDRRSLRAAPPPILVTNATMLEYMLVRSADRPLLGQGQLRWIVLDEAHSYVGSQAAEMTLLLRRAMHAFGVRPQDVCVIATSATLGEDADTTDRLKQFAADLSGRLAEEVVVVRGVREVPDLVPGAFDGLADYPAAMSLRDTLARRHATLRDLAAVCPDEDVVNLLQHCISARNKDNEVFLPIRLHLFHRAQTGIWACLDPACPGRGGTRLDHVDWSFGALLTRDAPRCGSCGGLTLQVLLCNDCGAPFLEASGDGALTSITRHHAPDRVDEFEAEAEEDAPPEGQEEDEDAAPAPDRFLLARPGLRGGARLRINRLTGDIADAAQDGLVTLGRHEPIEGCPCCGAGNAHERLFRPLRLGGPFMTGIAADTLLDVAPPSPHEPSLKPHGGRQMITFTDSRQGTARFAAAWQLETERVYARSVLYHAVQDASRKTAGRRAELTEQIEPLEQVLSSNPSLQATLGRMLATLKAERDQLPPGQLSWQEARDIVASRNDQQFGLRELWSERDAELKANDRLATMQLYREFLRRPTRGNNLETLGLAALRFAAIEKVTSMPPLLLERGATLQDWRDFLSICITFELRGNRACFIDDSLRNWVGQRAWPRSYVGHDHQDALRGTDLRWPRAKRGSPPRSRLVRLLAVALSLDLNDAETCRSLNDALQQAFGTLRGHVGHRAAAAGKLQLDLTQAELVRLDKAWICPFTNRLLDCCFRGFSPYLPPEPERWTKAVEVALPALPSPWLNGPDAQGELDAWLRTDALVEARRREGVWTDLHDRMARLPAFIRVAEHSAQQPSARLKIYEDAFKAGRVNALACSTTMEMGVDIGGIAIVAMTNVPPAPANYRQRVGRAGRRGEALALAFTYCADDPLGWNVFDRPSRLLDQPIQPPRVALDSRLIVQRHVNAWLLAGFLADPAARPAQDGTRLNAVWFFGAKGEANPPLDGFVAWLWRGRDDAARRVALQRLVSGSGLADTPDLADRCAEAIKELAKSWRAERDLLALDHDGAEGAAATAIKMQLDRMEREFLLKELTSIGFLPGHGFPTGVLPFVAISPAESARKGREDGQAREDGRAHFREFPSRSIDMAVREYAPGAEVVLDGLVYVSAGVTLNWKRPVAEADVQEIQSFRHFWTCSCGAADASRRRPEQCPACGRPEPSCEKVLIPAGFAADPAEKPTSDVETAGFVPFIAPGVFVGDQTWVALANPEAGRMRSSANGRIMGISRGAAGKGYALCLACGRVAPESGQPANPLATHRALRRGHGMRRCEAADGGFTVQRHIRLGYHRTTNVCELQFTPIAGESEAQTFAVALREALVRTLGIERDEVGWQVGRRPASAGGYGWSIFLYDTAAGGAGYASLAPVHLPFLLDDAINILDCANPACDTCCPSCLITRDTLQHAGMLNRMAMLPLITGLRDAVRLPADAWVFDGPQAASVHPIHDSIEQAISRVDATALLLRLSGTADSWDLASWWARSTIIRQADAGRAVILLVEATALAELTQDAAMALFALVSRGDGRVTIASVPQSLRPDGFIAAVKFDSRCIAWAARNPREVRVAAEPPASIVFSDHWNWPNDYIVFDMNIPLMQPTLHAARLGVTNELNGPMTTFGYRFWELLARPPSPLLIWIKTHPRLEQVVYSDRYLFSPLAVGLLCSVLNALAIQLGVRLPVQIWTQDQRPGKIFTGLPYYFHHDWHNNKERDAAIIGLISKYCEVDLRSLPIRELPHARMIRLIAHNGDRLEVLLDQGFGYWATQPNLLFDFSQQKSLQYKFIAECDSKIGQYSKHPTWMIIESMPSQGVN